MKFSRLLAVLLFTGTILAAEDQAFQVRLRYIEACSCDLFCVCYFNDHAAHQGTAEHKCTFNNVARVETGKYGDVNLGGLKVWLSGDLGPDWGTKAQAGWLVATFEPSATQAQKDALMAVMGKIYPVKWSSVQFDTSPITWRIAPDGKTAEAKLGNGKGEVKLTRAGAPDAPSPPTIQNVRYFASTWNSPFTLYYSDHSYKGFGKEYNLKHANGFTIVVEATSDGKRVEVQKSAPKKAD
jgi:hypothetical protein